MAAGASVGAPLRFYLGRRLDGALHLGTLLSNTVASLLLGLATGWAIDGAAWALVATGFCGGMSTYSSFAVQAHRRGARLGVTYAVLTLALGLGACALGFEVAA